MLHRYSLDNHTLNERGQATVAALVILPLALAISVGFLILGQALQIEAKTTASCRQSLVESQIKVAEALEELIQMNKYAKLARRLKKGTAVVDDIAAVVPFRFVQVFTKGAKFGARLFETWVMAEQVRWRLTGQFHSRLAPARAFEAMRESAPKGFFGSAFKSLFLDFEFSDAKALAKTRTSVPGFRLVATPAGSRTPDYNPAPDFEKSQAARVRLLLKASSADDDSSFKALSKITGFRKVFSPRVEFGCSVTLVKKGQNKWGPQILEDKLLSN